MNKSDLRTGMFVTLRNNESYYVMLNTGVFGDQQGIMVHRIGQDTGWMSLNSYAEDMTHRSDPDDIFPLTPEEDRMWDIVRVEGVRHACELYDSRKYKTLWERND